MATVSVDLTGLEALENFVKKTNLRINVGILEEELSRDGESINNAELGAVHEFGSTKRKIRANSFLRVPLQDNLPQKLKDGKLYSDAQFSSLLRSGKAPKDIGDKVGAIALGVVTEAFTSNGFGKWQNKHGPNKKTGQVLVDTGELRRSISYEVKDGN